MGGPKQRGIQAYGHNQGDPQPLAPSQQFEHGISTIGHKDQTALGRPASDLQDDLLGPIRQVLRLAPPALIITGRRSQGRQKRQGPDFLRPRHPDQQLHTEPAQAAGFVGDRLARTGGIAVNAPSGDPPTPASLNKTSGPRVPKAPTSSWNNRRTASRDDH